MEKFLIGLVALQHAFIMVMEMFLWEKRGPSIFKNFDKKLFSETTAMAKNMGIYNGFLAAGLTWSLLIKDPVWSTNIAVFFLSCVVVAGIYASLTAEKSIVLKQSLIAVVVLIFMVL
jgi:putative membrane protein